MAAPGGGPRPRTPSIGAGGRLNLTAGRFRELNGAPAGGSRFPLELIAREIRDHAGSVWASVDHFGISYEHALRVRAGWRGARVARALPIPHEFARTPRVRSFRTVVPALYQ